MQDDVLLKSQQREINEEIGRRARDLRTGKSESLRAACVHLNVTAPNLQKREFGTAFWTAAEVVLLAERYGVHPAELLPGVAPPRPPIELSEDEAKLIGLIRKGGDPMQAVSLLVRMVEARRGSKG